MSSRSLVGRDREIADIIELLSRDDVRVVTLTGPPGIGKTRIAMDVADEDSWFVSLVGVVDAELVGAHIARTLGVTDGTVVEHLAPLDGVVVIDNFEHVVGAASVIEAIADGCPAITTLVTSVVPLRIEAEHTVDVPPLDTQHAAELFVERARAVRPDFDPAPEAEAIDAICARLDGIPLAIELAAARVNILTPRALLERLDQPLAVLTRGPDDLPERHRTLRAAIAWTYDLLSGDEQRILRIAAAFSGGCRLDALTNVSGTSELDLLDLVAALVDRSLVRRDVDADGEPRYRMLESILTFAREVADEDVAPQHAQWFEALAARAEPLIKGPGQGLWLDRLEHDVDNFRAAFNHLLTQQPHRALALAASLWEFWHLRGYADEGIRALEAALGDATGELRTRALNAIGLLAWPRGDHAKAAAAWTDALALSRSAGDDEQVAQLLHNFGCLHYTKGELDDAQRMCEESLALRRARGERQGVAETLNTLGAIAHARGDREEAEVAWKDALRLRRELANRYGIAEVLGNLAVLAYEEGDVERTVRLLTESLDIRRELGDKPGVLTALMNKAAIASERGDASDSRSLWAEALDLARELKDVPTEVAILEQLDDVRETPADTDANEFAREGEYWTVRFDDRTVRLRDTKGMRYIAELLAHPGADLHALELAALDAGGTVAAASAVQAGLSTSAGDAGPILDDEAKRAYRERIVELEDEIREAREWDDLERAARAEDELDQLTRQLAAAFGLGGRERRAGSASERARLNVTRAVRTALKAVHQQHKGLADHLEHTVTTGTFCAYRPDPRVPIHWRVQR